MTLAGVDTQQSPLALATSLQPRREVADTRANQTATDKPKDQAVSPNPSFVQDQVSLSRKAQALSVTDSQTSKNSTFQQSPSPFDK